MAQEDLLLAPESLEALIQGIGDLRLALGPEAADGLAAVRAQLERALAARRDGDRDRAISEILGAMGRLSELAVHLDPEEAKMMRAIAGQFESALRAGRAAEA